MTKESDAELSMTAQERAEFERLHKGVGKRVLAFSESGRALAAVKDGKLWRAGGFRTWEDLVPHGARHPRALLLAGRLGKLPAKRVMEAIRFHPMGWMSNEGLEQVISRALARKRK